MPRRAVGRSHVGQHQPSPEYSGCLLEIVERLRLTGAHRLGVREDHVHTKPRCMSGEDFQVPVWRKSPGLTRLRDEVQHD
jgi:hypothetical protein